jgi:hypothetical protein
VVDPARAVATLVGVDDVLVVQREQERVPGFAAIAVKRIRLVMRQQLALVLDEFLALRDRHRGKDAVAMNRRAAGYIAS